LLERSVNPGVRVTREANGYPQNFTESTSQVTLAYESSGDCSAVVARQECHTWTVLRHGEKQAKFDNETIILPDSLHFVAADGAVYLVSKGLLQAYR
jgi:hypothetical protein